MKHKCDLISGDTMTVAKWIISIEKEVVMSVHSNFVAVLAAFFCIILYLQSEIPRGGFTHPGVHPKVNKNMLRPWENPVAGAINGGILYHSLVWQVN